MKFILIVLLTILSYSANYEVVESFSNVKSITAHKNIRVKKVKKKILKKQSKKVTIKRAIRKKRVKNFSKVKRAKLVIIIDDVTHRYQLNLIKSLPFKVTPSIFPPNRANMKSQFLAKGLKHYMVHLPLESDSKAMNKMHKTLFVTNSNKEIKLRVAEIKKLFPNVKFINNHTGSVFSQNYNKSKVLYKALIDNNITFLDSRTSKKTTFKKIAKEFKKHYYKCDHFIDNKLNTKLILKEIKKGIEIAKRNKKAVIIGHPHKETFKALKLAKKYFKDINIVYIDEL